ncbi:hypothetical protein [Helcococcus ovis]|nr:hypothetical protein [Helcococcus ovis]TFF66425.1 hypothetical protein EQF92_00335 [Helcococcus ovis]TFF66522.1 hypothetical protein EQF93_07065 [Helcococcus ovis]WNZ01679.1 hypothetical protein EQF90_002175 [Helcococcus ovis]
MKNIKIYMLDFVYSQHLCKLLNRYDDINCIIVEEYNKKDTNYIYVTDFYVEDNINLIKLTSEKEKYQNVDNIYQMIINKYTLINHYSKEVKIISFVNITENKPCNKLATDLYKEFNKKYNSLLLNFNYYYNYNLVENELGIDSLLFVEENSGDVAVNSYKNFNYIGASSIPIETNKLENTKKILKTIKKLNYNYIIVDLNFNLTQRNLEILKYSDIIIYYFPTNSDEIFISKNIQNINNFLNNTNDTKLTIEIRPIKSGYNLRLNNENIEINSLSKMVDLI